MCSYISGSGLVRVPNVILHKNAVQAVIAAPKPTRVNHPPCSVRDDLSHTKAVVFETPPNPIFTRADDGPDQALPHSLGLRLSDGRFLR